jgi:hypothetical protein
MISRVGFVAVAGCLLVYVLAAGAATVSPELVIEAPVGLDAVADEIAAIGRGDFGFALEVTGLFGFTAPISVIVAPESSELARQTPAWISGFATGRTRTIVLFPERVTRYPDDSLTTLVHHEVTHVLVAEAARGYPVPRWFNEGVATVAAREWGIEDRARYAAAVVGRRGRTTADLDRGFADGGRAASRAYAMSAAFVRWLRQRHGDHVTARILELLGTGTDFREAFVRTTGATLSEAEHRFFVREAVWHTWVPFLTSSGVLWAAITALALFAIGRRRAKSAAMREHWEAEEELAERVAIGPSRRLDFTRSRTLEDADDDVVN